MTTLLIVFFIILSALLLSAALSPLETLGWWAGWYGDEEDNKRLDEALEPPPSTPANPKKHFLVFLTGVHSVSDQTYAGREINLLEQLKHALPDAEVIEVFPYTVTNRALTGGRVFAFFWRWAYRRKRQGQWLLGFIINLRNIFQIAVSADKRYGPMYNQGSAEMILRSLIAHGYEIGSQVPISLVGYSGGGQIASGAAHFVKAQTNAPVQVISLGGALVSHRGLLKINRLYHLVGEDYVERFILIFFPCAGLSFPIQVGIRPSSKILSSWLIWASRRSYGAWGLSRQ
ncbi:MAG: hypothetical protein R2880_05605 [Deinococcales bacterium]